MSMDHWKWLCDHDPEFFGDWRHPTFLRARTGPKTYLVAKYWLKWNELCEKVAERTYRVENIDAEWPWLCSVAGVPAQPLPEISRSTNRATRWNKPFVDKKAIQAEPDLSWDELFSIDAVLASMIASKAVEYGYESPC
jgi:hypothetical protein